MHVCLVTPYSLSDEAVLGGVEAASLRLVHALLARGDVRVTVVAPSDVARVEHRGSVQIRWVRSGPPRLPGIVRYWTTERRALQSEVASVGADVVHVQAIAGWGIGLRGPRVFQMHGVPEEAVMHTQRSSRRLSRWVHIVVEGRGRRSFPIVAVVGEHMRTRFASQFRGEVLVAENTVPDAYFSTVRAPGGHRVLFGGVVSNRKNTLGVLHAFRGVVDRVPDATLHIAGDTTSFPSYTAQCMEFIKESGLSERVRLLGSISIDEMKAELADSSVLVLPSFNESAPIILCEAMAVGVPVITSRRDGMVTMVDDGVSGYLIEPDDVATLESLMIGLLLDDQRNRAMGLAGQAIARSRFSSAVLAETLLAAYTRTINAGGR